VKHFFFTTQTRNYPLEGAKMTPIPPSPLQPNALKHNPTKLSNALGYFSTIKEDFKSFRKSMSFCVRAEPDAAKFRAHMLHTL